MLSGEVPSGRRGIVPAGVSSLSHRALRPEGLHHPRGVAASGFPLLRIFPTAASRRSLDRVSVPVWLIILSDQLPVVALVGHYLTN